eukprot:TRINITY_DN20086_c0_g1_i9.p1 TRINITY_DN20086_c0_g1~~TRINITY_DN20086_c0_g1_i9.p1  ORF type:complete len:346 (-),score=67.41 TRINITY_DN20086_c0_g1_i9:315-1352(-)
MVFCLGTILPYDKRKSLFKRSVKGPFMVAPFIRLVPTVMVPAIAKLLVKVSEAFTSVQHKMRKMERKALKERVCLDYLYQAVLCLPRCILRILLVLIGRPLSRIVQLVFALDGDSVGGARYICRSEWIFKPLRDISVPLRDETAVVLSSSLRRSSEREEDARKVMEGALRQSILKRFEPMDEILEIKMSFLLINFMAPLMPLGLPLTLLARLFEVRTKLTKLLLLRQRIIAGDPRLLQQTQAHFVAVVAKCSVLWHVGLVVITYNPWLHMWPKYVAFGVWLAISCLLLGLGFLISHSNPCTKCMGRCLRGANRKLGGKPLQVLQLLFPVEVDTGDKPGQADSGCP